jgi:hypothetical protein
MFAQVWLQPPHENNLGTIVTKLKNLDSQKLTGADFSSISEVLTSAILKCLKLWDYKLWHRNHLQFIQK